MPVDYSAYCISADATSEDDSEAEEFAPGFAQWQPGQATVICSDTNRGVDVYIDLMDTAAPESVDDGWQDIVEFELTTEDGDIRLDSLMDGPQGPNLAHRGAGVYRFRLAATGRDPIDGKKPREQHLLSVWPVKVENEPTIIRLTSKFAAAWAAPSPPPKQVDWAQLATQLGVRLIVGWRDLRPPNDDPSALNPTIVTVSAVVEGSPGQVFKIFHNPILASIGFGGHSPVFELGETFHCTIPHQTYVAGLHDTAPDWWPWIGRLQMVGTWTDIQRFRRLALDLRLEDCIFSDETRPAKTHPLPAALVTINFAKHPEGREVTISHHNVPNWLADDVRQFWAIVLQRHRKHSKYAVPMPWSDWAHLAE